MANFRGSIQLKSFALLVNSMHVILWTFETTNHSGDCTWHQSVYLSNPLYWCHSSSQLRFCSACVCCTKWKTLVEPCTPCILYTSLADWGSCTSETLLSKRTSCPATFVPTPAVVRSLLGCCSSVSQWQEFSLSCLWYFTVWMWRPSAWDMFSCLPRRHPASHAGLSETKYCNWQHSTV